MKRRSRISVWSLVVCGVLLVLLVGCKQQGLQEDPVSFTLDGSSYTFQLPAGWEVEEDYKKVYNDAAVFGAADTNSRAIVFIRGQKSPSLTSEELAQQTEETLAKYYQLEDSETHAFEIDGHPAIYYKLKSVYDEEAAWLENYFVVTETHLVEFLFYRPRESSTDKQQDSIRQSVESLKLVSAGSQESEAESNGLETDTPRKIETDSLSLRLSGSRISEGQLVLRYVLTNKGSEAVIPSEEWQKLLSVSEGAAVLSLAGPVAEAADPELSYLQARGEEALQPGSSIESAAVYALGTEDEELTLHMKSESLDQTVTLQR